MRSANAWPSAVETCLENSCECQSGPGVCRGTVCSDLQASPNRAGKFRTTKRPSDRPPPALLLPRDPALHLSREPHSIPRFSVEEVLAMYADTQTHNHLFTHLVHLVAHHNLSNALCAVRIDLAKPLGELVKGRAGGHVVDYRAQLVWDT
jgi:hypothetical protein